MPTFHNFVTVTLLCMLCSVNAFRISDVSAFHSKMRHSPRIISMDVSSTVRNYDVVMGKPKQLVAPLYREGRAFGLEPTENDQNALVHAIGTIRSLFQRFLVSAKEIIAKVGRQKTTNEKKVVTTQDNTITSTFVTAPSTPINQMVNVKSGRMYAEAKLQEIDALVKRATKPAESIAPDSDNQEVILDDVSAINEVEEGEKKNDPYGRKRSVLDLADEDLAGKRVLVRCDLDVPVVNGVVSDDSLLKRSLATIQHLTTKGAKVILTGHIGTPAGAGYEAQHSLDPVAKRLSELLGQAVPLVTDCVGPSVGRAVSEMTPGGVALLENLRFYTEEENNDSHFAKNLAAQADVFVNDAVGAVHLALASTEGLAHVVPIAVSGLALKKELDFLHHAVQDPARPFVAIISAKELASHVPLFESLLQKADQVVVGGPMASAFTRGRFVNGATSKKLKTLAAERGVPIHVLSDSAASSVLTEATTVLWAGVGADLAHSHDSDVIVRALGDLTKRGGVGIAVGQGAASALEKVGLTETMSLVTSNEDISFELLRGSSLPGVASLNEI